MSTPTIPPTIPGAIPQQSSKATLAVVLGVLGIICCGLLAPAAWYLASEELKAINAGRLSEANRGMAQVAKILGIIGTILLGLAILWVVLFGGMATIGALTGAGGSY
jgi:TRAP-type C4-dicarboxylate transport system permease small subunit